MYGPGRGSAPMSSAHLEQQFQARIAQAKEAARLASIAAAAAARTQSASNGLPAAAVPGVPFRPPPIPMSPAVSASAPEPLSIRNIPPDVKNRIDRLVEFVARNGDAFEATAKQRERDNPDFAFLTPGGPFSDYYQWAKQQVCGSQQQKGPPMGFARTPSPIPQFGSPNGPPPVSTDPLGDMSVGAMANVCKFARSSGVLPYALIPQEVILNVGSLPPVEQARLEIRLSEFYRDEEDRRPKEL